uniref:Uncharacterized protein n=1 Tax=Arundo donax TaxID=35708 RepID=A0A0A9HK63_ARUDO
MYIAIQACPFRIESQFIVHRSCCNFAYHKSCHVKLKNK